MRYAVSVRQPDSVKAQADEIIVNYNDINIMYNMIENFPQKDYKIRIHKGENVNFEELFSFSEQVNITVALEDMRDVDLYKDKIKYYWGYPITTWAEVKVLIDLGVSELFIGAPLTFDLPYLTNHTSLPLRMIANKCYDDALPRENGICGSYIRPEDVETYGKYISTLEFDTDALSKEATLLEVYKSGEWPGNLNLLLTNLNYNIDNRAIPRTFGISRLGCGQRCQRSLSCHLCETGFYFATQVDKTVQETKSQEANIDN